jgi:hypothetical protein
MKKETDGERDIWDKFDYTLGRIIDVLFGIGFFASAIALWVFWK